MGGRLDVGQITRWSLRAIACVALSLSLVAPAFAAAAIAKIPKSVRHTYRDGTYTELRCDRAGEGFDCEFMVGKGRKHEAYSFRLAQGRMVFLSGNYSFWDHDKGRFTFAMDVSCQERELALLPKEAELYANCRMWFEPQDSELLPQRVEVTAYFGERDYKATLDLRAQGEKWPHPQLRLTP